MNNTGQILVVEDDVAMQKVLTRIFSREGFTVLTADNGAIAIQTADQMPLSAVVLDLLLPEISGRDVCRHIKSRTPETPVIIVSSVSDVVDKVLLLEIGADDYVTKPFSPRELLARVQAAIRRQTRRQAATEQNLVHFGECVVDFERMTATCRRESVVLTALEFKLLRYFITNTGVVLSRDTLLNKVWGYNAYPSTRTVDNQILKLRQKLEADPANPSHLLTIYGAGYKFVT